MEIENVHRSSPASVRKHRKPLADINESGEQAENPKLKTVRKSRKRLGPPVRVRPSEAPSGSQGDATAASAGSSSNAVTSTAATPVPPAPAVPSTAPSTTATAFLPPPLTTPAKAAKPVIAPGTAMPAGRGLNAAISLGPDFGIYSGGSYLGSGSGAGGSMTVRKRGRAQGTSLRPMVPTLDTVQEENDAAEATPRRRKGGAAGKEPPTTSKKGLRDDLDYILNWTPSKMRPKRSFSAAASEAATATAIAPPTTSRSTTAVPSTVMTTRPGSHGPPRRLSDGSTHSDDGMDMGDTMVDIDSLIRATGPSPTPSTDSAGYSSHPSTAATHRASSGSGSGASSRLSAGSTGSSRSSSSSHTSADSKDIHTDTNFGNRPEPPRSETMAGRGSAVGPSGSAAYASAIPPPPPLPSLSSAPSSAVATPRTISSSFAMSVPPSPMDEDRSRTATTWNSRPPLYDGTAPGEDGDTQATATSLPLALETLGKCAGSFTVRNKLYIRLNLLGRGGSSKVYRVLGPDCNIYALKRIRLKRTDTASVAPYINEIGLLRRLTGKRHIVQLVDYELDMPNKSILVVMEYGETDLRKLLQKQREADEERRRTPQADRAGGQGVQEAEDDVVGEGGLNASFVRWMWRQMLAAVATIHDERIVHGDLKPANFVMVEGTLKLIDFGIAKAISNDTTNIVRDSQVGTLNYMSPEAIADTSSALGSSMTKGQPRMKLGRASDIWSLGCILYQMVYGKTPFADLPLIQKLHAIINNDHDIVFPETPDKELDSLLRACLTRDPRKRPSIEGPGGLLQHPFLCPHRHYTSRSASPTPGAPSSAVAPTAFVDLLKQAAVPNVAIKLRIARSDALEALGSALAKQVPGSWDLEKAMVDVNMIAGEKKEASTKDEQQQMNKRRRVG